MKISMLLLAGLTTVLAMPVSDLEARATGATSNELKNGACKNVIFIMARGSTETGNMGNIPGPPTCDGLKKAMGGDQVACQGIGADDGYAAALAPNTMPKNTDDKSIAAATKIMTLAATKCPQSTVVMGGYSQGSAVVDAAIQAAPAEMQANIAGVVLFGYTRNAQDKAQIPGYPQDKTKIFCAKGDAVCNNSLTITSAHLSYAANAGDASAFLAKMATTKMAAKTAVAKSAQAAQVARMAVEFESAKAAMKARELM